MIKTIHLRHGVQGSLGQLPITAAPITIFIGPNNSGKSLALRQIEMFCNGHRPHYEKDVLIANVDFTFPSLEIMMGQLARFGRAKAEVLS